MPHRLEHQVAKSNIHCKKRMWVAFWNCEGIIHEEYLPPGQTIDQYYYCEILGRLNKAIYESNPWLIGKMRLQHDNARPHVSNYTQEVIDRIGWEVLPHPPYSPDLAPSDFHLFRSLSQKLKSETFFTFEDLKGFVDSFLRRYDREGGWFYKQGIAKLPERWQKCVDASGNYFDE